MNRRKPPSFGKAVARWSGILWLGAVLTGCGPTTRAPRDGAGLSTGATTPSIDVRLVGPGMVGPDVPHWPMFRHDSARTGRNGVARTAPPVLKWTFATKGEIWSSAAIGIDGTVYVG